MAIRAHSGLGPYTNLHQNDAPTGVAQANLIWEIAQLKLPQMTLGCVKLTTEANWENDFSAFIVADKIVILIQDEHVKITASRSDSLSVETAYALVVLYSLLTVSKIDSSKL